MMIAPTESVAELDRFCEAMIAIREEIRSIERGTADLQDNPPKHASHTADLLIADWTRPYPKKQAFFPAAAACSNKYWSPVARARSPIAQQSINSIEYG